MNNNDKYIESPKKEVQINDPIKPINNQPKKETEEKSNLNESTKINPPIVNTPKEKDNLEEPQIEKSKSEQITAKYTPLSQDSKPFNYKKIKEKNLQNNNEQNNINNNNNFIGNENNKQKNNNSNIEKNNDIKRKNFIKKNNYSTQSPVYTYFNESQKYLSEQYGQNKMKKSENQINKMS